MCFILTEPMPPAETLAQPSSTVTAKTRHFGRGHLVPLDGLRGVAILAVMASHLFAVDYQMQAFPVRLIGQILFWGLWGVDLFFVLSGFLITGILVDSLNSPHYFRNFYMRRVLRIFPLYYGVLLLLFALTPVMNIHWHGLQVPLLLYLQNSIRYLPRTDGMGKISLNHLWSLAVEEQFYLLWPLLVFLARTLGKVRTLALAGCASALVFRLLLTLLWQDGFSTHFNMLARCDALLLGGVLALLYRSTGWSVTLRWSRPLFFGTAGFLVLSLVEGSLVPFQSPLWTNALRSSIVALACGGLLVWSLRPGWFSRVCSGRVLRAFGKYSYGLYILHMIFLPLLSGFFRPLLLRLTGSKLIAVVGSAGVIVVMTSAAAWLSFHLYEKHFLRLKRFFEYDQPLHEPS